MSRMHIINKRSLLRGAFGYIFFGMAASVVGGAIWATPRIANQTSLEREKKEIHSLILRHKNDEALKRLDELAGKKFLFSSKAENVRNGLLAEAKAEETNDFDICIMNKDYVGAKEALSKVNASLFSEGEIGGLERNLHDINPDTLIEKADKGEGNRFNLYLAASKTLEQTGESREGLRRKIFDASLEDLNKLFAGDADKSVSENLKFISSYINKGEFSLGKEKQDEFLRSSSRFYVITFLQGRGDLFGAKMYLGSIDCLTEKLGLEDNENVLRGLAESTRDYAKFNAMSGDPTEKTLAMLNEASIISLYYNQDVMPSLIDSYLFIHETFKKNDSQGFSRKVLDSAAAAVTCLPREKRGEMQIKIADNYVELANLFTGTDAFGLRLEAKALYLDSGISPDDQRIKEIDAYSFKAIQRSDDD